jgi:hypothetical protein
MAWVTGVFSTHVVVVMGVGRAPVSCLLGEGRSELPSPLKVVWNSSVESSIVPCSGDGGPLWVEHKKAASESFLQGEAQAVEAVGDEVKAPKANSFTEGDATACQTFTVSDDGEHGWGNHQNI